MSEFVTKKINNEVVKAVKTAKAVDTRPIRGHQLYPALNGNMFFCAKTASGKTTVIFYTLKKCYGKNTKIIVFCSTLYTDPAWIAINEWADRKGIPFVGYTSLKDEEGVDQLGLLLNALTKQAEEAAEEAKGPLDSDSDEEEVEEEVKPKYQTPEYIFVLDDLSTELKSTSIARLVKISRHFTSKVILSSQWLNDLHPMARVQLKYILLFKDQPFKKIEEIHTNASLSIPLERFWQMYLFATKEPFSFLYVDTATRTFRRNFDTLIQV